MPELTPAQRDVLRAVVDTAVPALPPPAGEDDPTGFWATPGSATGATELLEWFLTTTLPEADLLGIGQLLDGMAMLGLQHQERGAREAILGSAAALSPEAAVAVQTLRSAACLLAHSIPDAEGRNPFWAQYGYPGPAVPAPEGEPAITPYVPADGEVIEADVVVIGSGAGGGTIAGILALQGRSVVVLEMGGASAPRDYRQLELEASATMMYRGGLALSADSNIGLLAGATLGGGTTINWQNCVRPSDAVRREWAEHGLADVATTEFDRHLDAVLERMGATDECSDLNGPHQRMLEGAKALGWSSHIAVRNVDRTAYDPAVAGYTQFGDPGGSKRGTLATYLQDAFDHGTKILVHTHADRVLAEDGRAVGVAATYTDPATGQARAIRVNAKDVVVAAGALETPAVLLRSGIGGPAVGKHLRLHPSSGVFGVYAEDQKAWWGPPQSAVMDEFRDLDGEGYGLLIEGSHYYSGVFGFQLARSNGREHKEAMSKLGRMSDLLFISREHGGGEVTLDDRGEAVHTYAFTDARDEATIRKGIRVLAELHLAAGAEELYLNVPTAPVFRRGQDLQAWLAVVDAIPLGAGGIVMGSAHQMGSARMGTDPATSVAAPTGELHDVPGVWIGDTSAFPTPSGANPMLTCMALAHRTAEHIAARYDAPSAPRSTT